MDGTRNGIRYPWSEPPAEGAAIEVAPGVLWMRLPLPMKLDHVNVYALDDGGSWTIVDTGFHSARGLAIWRELLAGPLGGRPVGRVVVTHHHPDHVGNAGWFQSAHGAELVTTRTAWLFARMLTLDAQERPTEETLTYWRRAGMEPGILAERAAERPFNFADVVHPMPLGFRRVRQGDTVRMGGRDWDVHIGNGHAPEHATLWSRDDNLVLSGDQILSTISSNIGVYATEPEADPVGEWMASCEWFRGLATPDKLVLPGHKLPYTGLPTRIRQLIENHESALDRLRDHLSQPRSAVECFPQLFKRKIGAGEYGLALAESVAHCQHLVHRGEVRREVDADGVWRFALR